MKLFTPVLNAYREWILSFSLLRKIQPFALYLMCIGLGIDYFNDLLHLFFDFYFIPLNLLDTLAYFVFFLGFFLLITTNEIKIAPYALFGKAFIILFPFTYFSLYSLISAAIYLFLGYQLLNYFKKEYATIPTTLPNAQVTQQNVHHD